LRSIGNKTFAAACLERVFLPASVTEVDPFAFSEKAWKIVKFGAPPPLLVDEDFLRSGDSRKILYCFSPKRAIKVPAHIEVIGTDAFRFYYFSTVIFPNGSRLREIGERAFAHSQNLSAMTVPSSVEILGDRCFALCEKLTTVTVEEISKLKKIGEMAFRGSNIHSITIPASATQIDGSAFLDCPLESIDIATGNESFIARGKTLLTSDGPRIVRYFGSQREIFVWKDVEVLEKSCFESFAHMTQLSIESGSKLRRIGPSALSGCELLRSIVVPIPVSEIEEFAFKGCIGLEECSIHKDAILTTIGQEAFAGCCCLRSFYVPKKVEGMGENCFKGCSSLSRLKFGSGETLKRFVREMTLDEALESLGFTVISSLFRIEVEDAGSDLSFLGWIPVADASSHLTLARHFG
jgi:hypothetical protein